MHPICDNKTFLDYNLFELRPVGFLQEFYKDNNIAKIRCLKLISLLAHAALKDSVPIFAKAVVFTAGPARESKDSYANLSERFSKEQRFAARFIGTEYAGMPTDELPKAAWESVALDPSYPEELYLESLVTEVYTKCGWHSRDEEFRNAFDDHPFSEVIMPKMPQKILRDIHKVSRQIGIKRNTIEFLAFQTGVRYSDIPIESPRVLYYISRLLRLTPLQGKAFAQHLNDFIMSTLETAKKSIAHNRYARAVETLSELPKNGEALFLIAQCYENPDWSEHSTEKSNEYAIQAAQLGYAEAITYCQEKSLNLTPKRGLPEGEEGSRKKSRTEK